MTQARPLRDIFEGLAGETGGQPEDVLDRLRDDGHADLPGELVTEAIVSYADTAPVEVAAHLAPFVTAHSAVPLAGPGAAWPDPAAGLDLLTTAPVGEPSSIDDLPPAAAGDGSTIAGPAGDDHAGDETDFGAGDPLARVGAGDDPYRLDVDAEAPPAATVMPTASLPSLDRSDALGTGPEPSFGLPGEPEFGGFAAPAVPEATGQDSDGPEADAGPAD